MTKFTNEEISLCKQVVEKHKKKTVRGDWYVHVGDEKNMAILHIGREFLSFKSLIPLWTTSDCLEFLMDKGYFRIDIVFLEGRYVLWLVHENEDKRYEPDGDTILEACLKAVLAVLEDKK